MKIAIHLFTLPMPPKPEPSLRPEGFQRVSDALQRLGHTHAPLWLEVAARTSQEAADALGVALGQIAKSVVFRRKADDQAVLVIASGDRRVDEARLSAIVGPVGRADAAFVKSVKEKTDPLVDSWAKAAAAKGMKDPKKALADFRAEIKKLEK